jgi:hypothetical protein
VELLSILLVLYLLEGIVFLPPGVVGFARVGRGWTARPRTLADAALASLPPRPGALPIHAAPLPFVREADGLRATAPVGALGLPASRRAAASLPCETFAAAEASGARVRAGDVTFLRAISHRHARDVAAWLRRIATAAPEQRDAAWRALHREAADVAALRERVAHARSALRRATLLCDAYACGFVVFAALLVAVEVAWPLWVALGVLLLLHVATLWSARAAHRSLLPDAAARRREIVLAAAIYPPSLLRLPQRIFLEAVGVPLPAIAAAALLAGEERVAFLRRALARLDHDPDRQPGEREALLAATAAVGIDADTLRRAPERSGANAVAWCPRCFEQFQPGPQHCADCDVALRSYAS